MIDVIKTLTSTLDELTIDWVTPYLDDREVEAVRQQATAITVEGISTAGLGDRKTRQWKQLACKLFEQQEPQRCKEYMLQLAQSSKNDEPLGM